MKNPNEPAEDAEEEARLALVGKAAVQREREARCMGTGIRSYVFPGGHPGPIATNWFFAVVNHTRRDD